MRTFLSPPRFRQPLHLYRLINPKPISSQSQILNPPNNNLSPNTELKSLNLTTIKPDHSPEINNTHAIKELLTHKNNPISALNYYNSITPSTQIYQPSDLFWILIHIQTYNEASNLLIKFITTNPTLTPTLIITKLVNSAQRFDFELNPRVLNCLLRAYNETKQTKNAIDCVNSMNELNIVPLKYNVDVLISSLVKSYSISEAKEIYYKITGSEIGTSQLSMRVCLIDQNYEEALKIFETSKEGGEEVDSLMYNLAIQAAVKLPNNTVQVLELLKEMREKLGVNASQESYTSLIVGLVKEGNMEEAVKVKDEMVGFEIPISRIAETSLIYGYRKGNELGKALDLMEEEGLVPNKGMFTNMIKWLCRCEKMEEVVKFYKKMRALSIVPSTFLVHTMIEGCLKAESPELALEIVNETGHVKGLFRNKILQLLCKQGKIDVAMNLMERMENVNVGSYNDIILACFKTKKTDLARGMYLVMLEKGIEPNNFTYSILINGFFKNGDEESALDVINRIKSSSFEANEVVYNTIINGLCKIGQTVKAKELLPLSANVMSYNSIIDGFFREGKTDSAVETFREMCQNGVISPNVVTFTSMINGHYKSGKIDLALEIREEMKKSKDLKLDLPFYGALIDAFGKKGDMETAMSLFDELVERGLLPNVSVYNSLISGYRHIRKMDLAVEVYKKMVEDGIKCDLFTSTTMIDGLLKEGNLVYADELYSEVVGLGMVPDEVLYSVLVNGLSKEGQFVEARKMLEEGTSNMLIYSAVIAGYFREGELDETFRVQGEMLEKGFVLDDNLFGMLVRGTTSKQGSQSISL